MNTFLVETIISLIGTICFILISNGDPILITSVLGIFLYGIKAGLDEVYQ